MRFLVGISSRFVPVFCLVALSILLNGWHQSAAWAAKRNDLNLANLATLTSVDPHATRNLNDVIFLKQIYEPLVWQNELTGKFENRLAENYARADDGLSYIFTLRSDVKFHNGDHVKASDVAFSLTRVKKMPVGAISAVAIENVTPIDDHTVKITLNKKNASFLSHLSNLFIISEREVKEQGDAFGTKINRAGTGPYFLTYLDRAVKWDCEAFTDYYRGLAPIKYLHFTVITDASAGLITFESGELDYYLTPIADWEVLAKSDKYNTALVPANHISHFMVNWAHGPLQNDKLREAIAYAVDKEAMNIACFNGHAMIADFMVKPGANIGAPSEGVHFTYDPERARRLVKEAGYEKGVHIGKILTIAGNYYEKMAQVMQANLADVGISVDVMPMETTTTLVLSRKQDFDITCNGTNLMGDYEDIRRFIHSSQVGSYYVKFEGDKFDYKKFDDLLDRGGEELDPEKRAKIYREVNDLVMRTYCFLPMFHRSNPYVWSKGLRIPALYPNTPFYYEWSWE
jgi:peptide/nickel transport system substrate-binding protein